MRAQPSEAWCYAVLRRVRWPRGVSCPFCGRSRVTPHSKSASTPRRRYLCLGCRRTFTDLTDTPFARTHLTVGTWFLCLRLLGEGRNTAELAKALGVKWDTAAHLKRRLTPGLGRRGLVWQLREAARAARATRDEGG
ncbi:MAG: transposase [Planctomycetota bacterium]